MGSTYSIVLQSTNVSPGVYPQRWIKIHTFMVSARPWSQTCPIRNTELERAFVGDQKSKFPVLTKQNVQPNEIK